MKKTVEESSSESEELLAENSEESEDESEPDLGASSTESDEDDDDDAAESSDDEETGTTTKTRAEIIEEKIQNKYEKLKGTRLYVRFPKKIPIDEQEFQANVKSLHPLVSKSTKPRQKHARFCLVDFKSQEDRDQAFEAIKKSIETDPAFKGIFVSLPKTDSDEFVNELVTKQQLSVENKRTKSLMKREAKKGQRKGNFTSSVVITNLPKTSSVAQVRQLFENAVDIQIKPGKGKFREFSAATVTLPTTFDARKAIKQDLSLAGTKLQLRFNAKQQKRKPKDKLKRKAESGEGPRVPKKLKKLNAN
ncbi:nucleolin 2 [Drosophila miranda]|uniref:nucleolin 2 n=1 Tax=Drosophila miranda TaxID=7229 RepID=UPI0007E6259F|nr:nucleolin 2 [Drosophila miranda]